MNNSQSNPENKESFYWFLKTLREEREKTGQQSSAADEPLPEAVRRQKEIDLLRFIKVFTPSKDKFMEVSQPEFGLSLIEASNILEKLEKDGEITSLAIANEIKLTITDKGRARLDTGG
jgi:hypothetical protein